ncbi:MAG TPA: trehalose-phosphatase, partial [bacterium]|nr:trehalose-phosphatase [bacterium]
MRKSRPPFVFLLDYDGTLTDFERNPDHSRLTPFTRGLLLKLSRKFPLVLVSGRNVESLRRVSGLKTLPLVGSHGFEASRLPGVTLSTPAQRRLYRREAAALW